MNARTLLYRLVGLLVVVAVGGAPLAVAAAVTPPMGSPVTTYQQDTDEYQLVIECAGEGSPTVLLAAGLRGSHDWGGAIKSDVARVTRVCSYDRAGRGQGEANRSPANRAPVVLQTSQDMVQALHAALGNANIRPPYVLAGHHVGGLNARLYADQYPDEVVGMVLTDAMHEDQDARLLALLPPAPVPRIPAYQLTMQDVELDQLRAQLGHTIPDTRPRNWPPPQPDSFEGLSFDWLTSFAQLRVTGSLGDLPLVVLTSGQFISRAHGLNDDFPYADPAQLQHILLELQRDLAQRSTNSTHIIVEVSGPLVYHDHPAVLAAIHQVIDAARHGTRVDGALVTALPETGAADGRGRRVALGALAASLLFLASGYVLRRRGHTM